MYYLKNNFTILSLMLLASMSIKAQGVSGKDSLYVLKLINRSKHLLEIKKDSSVFQAIEALNHSIKTDYLYGQIISNNALGNAYKESGNYKKALLYYNKSVELATKMRKNAEIGNAFYNMANAYQHMGLYDLSFECVTKSITIKRNLKDSIGESKCYRQVAECMNSKGGNKQAIFYFKKAIDLQRKLKAKKSLATTLSNFSVILIEEERYTEALQYLQEARILFSEDMDDTNLASVYLNLGYCYSFLNSIDSTIYYYGKTLTECGKNSDIENEITCLSNLGEFYLTQKNYQAAEKVLLDGIHKATQQGSLIDLKHLYTNICELYVRKNDYRNAFFFKENLMRVSDSLLNINKIKAVEDVATKFQVNEINLQNKNLQNQIELQKIKTERKNYLMYGSLILAILTGAIFVLYIRQNKFKMQKESIDIEQKLLQIQMNPHFIFNSLQAIQSFILTNKKEQSAGYLTSFSRLMRLILENSRHEYISLDKEITTLTYYLELQKLRFKDVFDYIITVEEDVDKEFLSVPPMLLQPFIENAIEHGFKNLKTAGEIQFNVSTSKNYLIMQVIDNGIGIEASAKLNDKKNHHSYALKIINKRIALLNLKLKHSIKLSIEDLSKKNNLIQGTKITIEIPFINP